MSQYLMSAEQKLMLVVHVNVQYMWMDADANSSCSRSQWRTEKRAKEGVEKEDK